MRLSGSKASAEAYEVLQDPKKRDLYDRGGDPLGGGIAASTVALARAASTSATWWTRCSASRPRAAHGRGSAAVRTRWFASIWSLRRQLRYHQAAAGGYRRALPTLQWVGRIGGLPAGQVSDLPRSGRRDPRSAILYRRYPDHPALPNLPRLRHGHSGPLRGMLRGWPGPRHPTINVKIPAGVSTGNRIHLSSQGEVGAGGGPAGDLYVELQVLPHEVSVAKAMILRSWSRFR